MHMHITGLDLVDLSRFDPMTAYRSLGEDVRKQVWKISERILTSLSSESLFKRIRRVRSIQKTIISKQRSSKIPLLICNALSEYQECLKNWSIGINFTDFLLQKKQPSIDGHAITPFDLALVLQDEYGGCQTGAYRDDDGSVIFWHTEEAHEKEPGQRFDRFRLAQFTLDRKDEPVSLYSFIYPDLLPGPSFAWRSDGYVQMVDFLILKPDLTRTGLFANLATWITLRLGMQLRPELVVRHLAPFFDGYSLMYVNNFHAKPQVGRIEFAANKHSPSSLGDQPGSFLFQVNIFSSQSAHLVHELEGDPNPERQLLIDRIHRTEQGLSKLRPGTDHMRGIHRILKSKDGGSGAYNNQDVKAHLIGKMTSTELKLHPAGSWAKGTLQHR